MTDRPPLEHRYYKAVDSAGLSFFPFDKKKRLNWIDLIDCVHSLTDDVGWLKAVEKMRKGDTVCCTEYLLHGYADIALAIDFGKRNAEERPDQAFRIVEFTGMPVARLEGALLLNVTPWDDKEKETFADAVKYGFRSVKVLREVLPAKQLPSGELIWQP